MSLLLVHSNNLNPDGTPGIEYLARLKSGAKLLQSQNVSNLLLVGGKATKDVDVSHVDSGRGFLLRNGVDSSLIKGETLGALDTVGEIVFSLLHSDKRFAQLGIDKIDLKGIKYLTTDYHVPRIQAISDFVFGNESHAGVQGIDNQYFGIIPRTLEQEIKSIDAFYDTFSGVQAGDVDDITRTLFLKHPLYKYHIFSEKILDIIGRK